MRRLALLLAAGLAGCASLPSARPAGDADAGAQVHRQRLEALGLAEGRREKKKTKEIQK